MKSQTRRNFIRKSWLGSLAAVSSGFWLSSCKAEAGNNMRKPAAEGPVILSTWDFGVQANREAEKVLADGGSALDAVEAGVKVVEADPLSTSVGYGGLPDRDGHVTLDACIMNDAGKCGSVCFLEHIMHPISVARQVMEKTPHIMLAGSGALQFAIDNGFKKENLLTEAAEKEWKEWKEENDYAPTVGENNHDTIGMLVLDNKGKMSGACTTSGAAFKYHGRVGDSPIIGAGLYVDNQAGGAVATGLGEKVIEIAGSFLVVELMRQGKSPQIACEEAVARILKRNPDTKDLQVGFLAMNMQGECGAYSVHNGFQYAMSAKGKNELLDSTYFKEW